MKVLVIENTQGPIYKSLSVSSDLKSLSLDHKVLSTVYEVTVKNMDLRSFEIRCEFVVLRSMLTYQQNNFNRCVVVIEIYFMFDLCIC